MTKLAPEWVRTSDPVIRSPVRYHWTTAPACVFFQKEVEVSLERCAAILRKTGSRVHVLSGLTRGRCV